MKSVTLNLKVDGYSNRVLDVVRAVYGLSNKSEALNKVVHEFGPAILEPELNEKFAQEILKDHADWKAKHRFTRKTTLKDLDRL